ncbi:MULTISPECIES: uracil-DNA glycosylase [Nocardioides]|uniref:Type-5 uracil-DNA glycosylase n=1 Tax=Nocardioides vastitatis TaxID=2568655 RepID=A0ABW0ZHH0_9ACTN|nr:uracil-DNA glycosylase [Nocardioides sp.]THI93467.1 uracil-DNA glycosylase [Nocardioides sp.]
MRDAEAELARLDDRITRCRRCPRLVRWREQVAREKRAAFAEEEYWGRPVPGFGPADARILVVGLAPAAHGANRTGRIFTGDRSGDWLFAAMHRVGLANQPTSTLADDGLTLFDTRVLSAVRCAPPANRPTPQERDNCAPWLDRELAILGPSVRVILALGSFGWDAALRATSDAGWAVPRPRPRFGHAAEVVLERPVDSAGAGPAVGVVLLGCFHPSQQNTFTGRLTEPMTDAVLGRAVEIARSEGIAPSA